MLIHLNLVNYYGEIIILINRVENFKGNLNKDKKREHLFNIYYNLYIKYLHILLVKIDQNYNNFYKEIYKLYYIHKNINLILKHLLN